MSDTGFTRFFSIFRPAGTGNRAATLPNGSAQLISIPENIRSEIKTLHKNLKIQGEVVRENKDRSLRIRTPRGDIDIRPQNRTPRLEQGAQVEIEIHPAQQGRQPLETATVTLKEPPPAQRSDHTPVDIELRSNPAPPAQTPPPPARPVQDKPAPTEQAQPQKNNIIRLIPLLPGEPVTVPPPEIIQALLQTTLYSIEIQIQNQNAPLTGTLQIPQTPPGAADTSAKTSILTPPILKPLSGTVKPQTLPIHIIPAVIPAEEPYISVSVLTPQYIQPPLHPQNLSLDAHIETILPPALTLKAPETGPETEPETKPPALILQNHKAQSLTATVTGFTKETLPVVTLTNSSNSETHLFALQGPATAQTIIGAQIRITPLNLPQQAQTITQETANLTFIPLPLLIAPQESWPLMEDLQTRLANIIPQTAQAISNITPSPANPAQFGPAALFFIAALRGGDLTQWLDEKTLDALRREGGKNFLSRLAQEGRALSRATTDSGPQDWRITNFPLLWHEHIQKAALYYKHESPDKDSPENGPKGTRFVFDLALDKMGNVQIDGLFRPVSDKGKRLDLAVRTKQPFSQTTQAEMRRVYAAALRNTGVTGELSFQNRPDQWVTIQAPKTENFGVSA